MTEQEAREKAEEVWRKGKMSNSLYDGVIKEAIQALLSADREAREEEREMVNELMFAVVDCVENDGRKTLDNIKKVFDQFTANRPRPKK